MASKNHPKTRNQPGTKTLTELRYVFLSFKVKKHLMRTSLIKLNNLTLKLIVFVAGIGVNFFSLFNVGFQWFFLSSLKPVAKKKKIKFETKITFALKFWKLKELIFIIWNVWDYNKYLAQNLLKSFISFVFFTLVPFFQSQCSPTNWPIIWYNESQIKINEQKSIMNSLFIVLYHIAFCIINLNSLWILDL